MTAQHTFKPHYVTNQFGERYLENINQSSFVDQRSATLYEQKYGESLFHEDTIYIVVGSDSGLLSHYIAQQGTPSGSKYIFVEPNSLLKFIDIKQPLDNIIFTSEDEWLDTAREAGIASYSYKGNVSFLYSMAAGQANHPIYKSLNTHLEEAVKQLLWRYTTQFDIRAHNQQILENIGENQIPASILRNIFPGKTAVIMGAGPSLDQFIPWIKEHRDQIILLAVSRLSKSLLNHNITPDIIATVDPQTVSYVISQAMLELDDQCLLVNSSSASNQLISQWPGRSVFLNNNLPWNAQTDPKNIQACAPTVTNTAFNMAIALGAKKIILMGIDLCYSPEGYSHSSGNVEREKGGALTAAAEHTVKTNSGQLAETNRGYFAAIEAFSEQSEVAKSLGCHVINPAPDAAIIDHVSYIPLADINITQPLTLPAYKTIQQSLPANTSAQRLTHYNTALSEIENITSELKTMKMLVSQAITYNNKLLNKNGLELSPKFKLKLDKIENKLQHKHRVLDSLIKTVFGSDFAQTISTKEDHELTITDVIEQGDFYYRTYERSIKEYIKSLDLVTSRLLDRCQEERSPVDVDKLCTRWRNDHQLGRASVWKKHHPEEFSTLPSTEQEKIHQLIEDQANIIEAERQGYYDYVDCDANKAVTLGKLLERLITMYHQQDAQGLMRLLSGLELRTDPISQQITLLNQGFLAELNQDIPLALSKYQALNAADEWLTKQTGLERIMEISIEQENIDAALDSLKQLSQHVPSYIPYYAQLLEVTGNVQAVAQLYDEQLNTDPNNLDISEQYALFLIRHHATEGAQALLEAIKKVPDSDAQVATITEALVSC